jgi:putative ABC transport system substrate-binding protein
MSRLGALIVLAVLVVAPAGRAQPPDASQKRIAALCTTRCEGRAFDALRRGLREHGWIEGKNLRLDARGAEGDHGRLRGLADQLLAARPDVLVAMAPQPVRAARDATSTVPIVMVAVADPVSIGLVPSLTRPGGNLTGVTTLPGRGFIAKQVELLKELVPTASRIAVFWNSRNEIHRANLGEELALAAEQLGVQFQRIDIREVAEVEPAFEAAVRGRADALLVVGDPITFAPAARVPERALKAGLPAIYLARDVAVAGGLIAYGPDFLQIYRRAADYVDRILKGAKPAEMPIEQPTKFELVVNLKTARARAHRSALAAGAGGRGDRVAQPRRVRETASGQPRDNVARPTARAAAFRRASNDASEAACADAASERCSASAARSGVAVRLTRRCSARRCTSRVSSRRW